MRRCPLGPLPVTVSAVTHRRGLKQVEAAKVLGLSQPAVTQLLRGSFREYSVERLMGLLTALGRDVEVVNRERSSRRSGRLDVQTDQIAVPTSVSIRIGKAGTLTVAKIEGYIVVRWVEERSSASLAISARGAAVSGNRLLYMDDRPVFDSRQKAIEFAKKEYDTGRYPAVAVYPVGADPDASDFGEPPVFRCGKVPNVESSFVAYLARRTLEVAKEQV